MLVETRTTLVSAGTERMLLDFGRANLLAKARSQPDKVRQVLDKVRTDGLSPTLEAVRAKLEAPIPLGYCNAGVVVETGPAARGFKPGDRVVTNGSHSEYVRVPWTLTARIPDAVSYEAAAFTPVAAIGLQGIRLADPKLGETVVVFGLGLIGLLTVQLLRANGCSVIGIDRDPSRLALAERFGAVSLNGATSDVVASVLDLTNGRGADAVLLTLAAKSDEPVRQAAGMSRQRGRIVLVGVTGLNLVRDDFYKKELSFSVSCSYGPGRYDQAYEEQGHDYPFAFVRWTEQRNFEAVLGLMNDGVVDPTQLITHRFDFLKAPDAYQVIGGKEPSLGVLLEYSDRGGAAPTSADRVIHVANHPARPAANAVGVLGAGNFAVRTLLPVMKASGLRLRTITSSGGTSGSLAAAKFGFDQASTDVRSVIEDPEIGTVFILTRHDSHASLVKRALAADKHVFVEKPLALLEEDLDEIEALAAERGRMVMVGFNRRFAPLTKEVQGHLRGRAGPVAIVATVNAGAIPRDHWTQDAAIGGGRIIGEACHWIDLSRALVDSPISGVSVTPARDRSGTPIDDIAHIAVAFQDGSTSVVHYLANGGRSFPKERIECFFDGKTVAIDNWRRLRRFGIKGPLFERASKMDKGHEAEIRAWADALGGTGVVPIPLDQTIEVSRWAIRADKLARES